MQEASSHSVLPAKQTILVGLAAAAFLVLLGGLAYACLPYKGVVSVYPVNPGGQAKDWGHERSVTIHGGAGQPGTSGGMRWCTGDGPESEPYAAGAIRPSANSADMLVVVESPQSGCLDEGDVLPMGGYNVAIRHAVYGTHANPDFDKDAVSEAAGDRAGTCYYVEGTNDPADYDYLHPEQLMVGMNGGSLLIQDTGLSPSPAGTVAGLCLRSNDHNRAPIVPVEIIGAPGNSGNAGMGMGNGRGR